MSLFSWMCAHHEQWIRRARGGEDGVSSARAASIAR